MKNINENDMTEMYSEPKAGLGREQDRRFEVGQPSDVHTVLHVECRRSGGKANHTGSELLFVANEEYRSWLYGGNIIFGTAFRNAHPSPRTGAKQHTCGGGLGSLAIKDSYCSSSEA